MRANREFNEGFLSGVLLTFVAMFLILIVTCSSTANTYKQRAVEHGFAEYDKTTGEWQWKDDEK